MSAVSPLEFPQTVGDQKRESELVSRLRDSVIFREYQSAFTDLTALRLELRTAGTGVTSAPILCVFPSRDNRPARGLTCSTYLTLQDGISRRTDTEKQTLKCFAGMQVSLIPVFGGKHPIAYLQTGHVLFQNPTEVRFLRALARLGSVPGGRDVQGLKTAYFQSRVMQKSQYDAVVRLVAAFAVHLSSISSEVVVIEGSNGSGVINKALAFIAANLGEQLSLATIAAAVFSSPFHFCKKFKKVTGYTLTAYIARLRVDRVKHAMLSKHVRVSEAAFEAGFQSLSQFNRVFRRLEGASPTRYRKNLRDLLLSDNSPHPPCPVAA